MVKAELLEPRSSSLASNLASHLTPGTAKEEESAEEPREKGRCTAAGEDKGGDRQDGGG